MTKATFNIYGVRSQNPVAAAFWPGLRVCVWLCDAMRIDQKRCRALLVTASKRRVDAVKRGSFFACTGDGRAQRTLHMRCNEN
jgi:hypothetical protein